MTVVCAWCGKDIRTKPGPDEVSHGICPACLEARHRAPRAAEPGPETALQRPEGA